MPRPLSGLRLVEIAGIGPAPFCGMHLADLGAEVILIERPEAEQGITDLGAANLLNRGKRSITLDLKTDAGVDAALRLIAGADGLIEGMRPGVMERLGLGPDVCLARNPHLVYGRMTGWGQEGPLAAMAGHDINYIAVSGALWYASPPGARPISPPTLLGDLAGGALYLAIGMLAALLAVRAGAAGQVVDAAIVDGSAHLMNLLLSLKAAGGLNPARGTSLLDGPHFYDTYQCADGAYVAIGALEPKFYQALLAALGLAGNPDFAAQFKGRLWPDLKMRLQTLFLTRTQAEWVDVFAGHDACFTPVLDPEAAARHPHMVARGIYCTDHGHLQAMAAPRFSGTPPEAPPPVPVRGADGPAILHEVGFSADEVRRLLAS